MDERREFFHRIAGVVRSRAIALVDT